ncbi:MAG: hypothetical protein IT319_18275 [Anaerolineae bacterium]|nr:hypothetical protein [Anaerolineae bacterium]
MSLVRIGVIAGIIGVLIVAAAAASYLTTQNAARSPLEISPYPNAVYWGTSDVRDTSRNVFYRVADTPESVVGYYQQKLNEHYGNSDQSCVRLPATGNAPGSEADPNVIPYLFRCVFDNSGFNTSQYTQVEIYPGRADADPNRNAEGLTVVKYMEYWMR